MPICRMRGFLRRTPPRAAAPSLRSTRRRMQRTWATREEMPQNYAQGANEFFVLRVNFFRPTTGTAAKRAHRIDSADLRPALTLPRCVAAGCRAHTRKSHFLNLRAPCLGRTARAAGGRGRKASFPARPSCRLHSEAESRRVELRAGVDLWLCAEAYGHACLAHSSTAATPRRLTRFWPGAPSSQS